MGKIVFLGVEGSGKSTLTVALATLFSEYEKLGWSLRPENRSAFAFSLRMPKRFAEGEMPVQTSVFRHLHWSLCLHNEPVRSLEMLDYPGEVYRLAFLDPSDDRDPSTLKARLQIYDAEIRELMAFVKEAEHVFILFNTEDGKNLDTDDANVDAVWVTTAAIKILSGLPNAPRLTLLLTQADRLEAEGERVDDPMALVRKYIPYAADRFGALETMAISAKDYRNERYGILPLAASIVKESVGHGELAKKWSAFAKTVEDGTATEKESESLSVAAKAYGPFSCEARSFLALNARLTLVLRDLVAQNQRQSCVQEETKRECEAILKATKSPWGRLERLRRLRKQKEKSNAGKASIDHIEDKIRECDDDRVLILFGSVSLAVILLIVLLAIGARR